MSRERPNQKQICGISMAGPEVRYCPRETCEFWRGGDEACAITGSLASISYNLHRLVEFLAFQAKKRVVNDLIGRKPREPRRRREPDAGS